MEPRPVPDLQPCDGIQGREIGQEQHLPSGTQGRTRGTGQDPPSSLNLSLVSRAAWAGEGKGCPPQWEHAGTLKRAAGKPGQESGWVGRGLGHSMPSPGASLHTG